MTDLIDPIDANYLDLNQAAPQYTPMTPIPADTLVKAAVSLTAGGKGEGGWLTQSQSSEALYVRLTLTVLEGPYAHRVIYHRIGILGTKRNHRGEDLWGKMGRSQLRAMAESAHHILPQDHSARAQQLRRLSDLGAINGWVCVIRVGCEKAREGFHAERNHVADIITPDHPHYQSVMGKVPATATTAALLSAQHNTQTPQPTDPPLNQGEQTTTTLPDWFQPTHQRATS